MKWWIATGMMAWLAGRVACGAESGPELERILTEKVITIQKELGALRGLEFKVPVEAAIQSTNDFKAYVERELERQFGRDRGEAYVRAAVRLGLLEKEIDLFPTYLKLAVNQAAAHYDPASKRFYLIQTNMPVEVLGTIIAHELCHALQDQHFDLHQFAQADLASIRDNGDAALARQSLLEGDATWVMSLWTAQGNGLTLEQAELQASTMIRMQGAMGYDMMMRLPELLESGGGAMDEGLRVMATASLRDLNDVPRALVEPLFDAYLKGGILVDALKASGGWAAVNAAYGKPPRSTEQVLHPEKMTAPADEPVDVRLPALITHPPAGFRLEEEDVAGEMGLRVFFGLWQVRGDKDPAAVATASAGWDGDRYYYLTDPETHREMLVWKTVWDGPGDATEFSVAYRTTLGIRFPQLKKLGRNFSEDGYAYQTWEVEPGRFIRLLQKDDTVILIDVPDAALLDMQIR